jgi:hypothetical protein
MTAIYINAEMVNRARHGADREGLRPADATHRHQYFN